MGYNVATLPAYVEQQEYPLIHKSLFSAKTQKIVRKQKGIKSQATINIMDDTSTFQPGGCGFNPLDSTTLSQRTITVGYIKVDKNWCPSTLNSIYAQTQLNAGSYNEEIPFWDVFTELQAGIIAEQLETALWQGDVTSANANLAQFDGFIKQVSGCTGYVAVSGYTGITTSNAIAAFMAVYQAIPAQVVDKKDAVILCGLDVFKTFTVALTNANLFHYENANPADFEIVLPGTNIKIIALNGLNGTGNIYAGRLSNFVMGVDLESEDTDFDSFRMWWSQDFQEVRMTVKFKAGANVAFCNEIVWLQA
jgi:hypothetical protein